MITRAKIVVLLFGALFWVAGTIRLLFGVMVAGCRWIIKKMEDKINPMDEFWCSMFGVTEEGQGGSASSNADLARLMGEIHAEVQSPSALSRKNGFKKTEIKNVFINPGKNMISIRVRPDCAICFNIAQKRIGVRL